MQKLFVSQSRSADAGIYVCLAENEAGRAQQAYTLEVLVPPKIHIVSDEQTALPLGQPLSLKCGARGNPQPTIAWFTRANKDADKVPVDPHVASVAADGTLSVPAMPGGTHTYVCEATNDAGTDTKAYVVSAISAPRLLASGEQELNVTQGDPAALVCGVDGGDPPPDIVWYKNGQQLDTYKNPTMLLNAARTQLDVGDTRLTDAGRYSCVAVNAAGNASVHFVLNVAVAPKITEEPRRVIVKAGERVELPCEAVGVPEPQISWTLHDAPLEDDPPRVTRRSHALVISRAEPGDARVYTCRASNWAGRVFKDIELVVLGGR